MSHFHHHDHSHGIHSHSESGSIRSAFFLNAFFTIIEIIGGIMTNSMAILSDAVHDLGDTFALGMGYYFEKISDKREDFRYTYGYRRYSPLSAVINATVLTVGSVLIIAQTVPRLLKPEAVDTEGMLFLAILGVIVNGVAVFKLSKNKGSANHRVMMLHLMEDVLGWVAVLIGSLVMHFYDLPIIDPILSMGIACYVLFNALRNIKQIVPIFLQAVPYNISVNKVKASLEEIKHVLEVHDIHVWSLDGEFNIITIHVVVDESLSLEKCFEVKRIVRDHLMTLQIQHATIEIELSSEHCDITEAGSMH
ncbi:cation diffusion facilitator family transporter [Limibacter armeniacum]|uniref:cation diffusion facilitator family transporter n=1 Tax=Limibacter armeniacum TaxID=466084 RepID=UPI002FE63A6D